MGLTDDNLRLRVQLTAALRRRLNDVPTLDDDVAAFLASALAGDAMQVLAESDSPTLRFLMRQEGTR